MAASEKYNCPLRVSDSTAGYFAKVKRRIHIAWSGDWLEPYITRISDRKRMKNILVRLLFVALSFATAGSANAITCSTGDEEVATACSDEDVRVSDSEVVSGVEKLLSVYSQSQRQSLISGQLEWLRLRGEACNWNGHPAESLNECMVSVNNERAEELRQLVDVQRNQIPDKIPALDLESLLDEPVDLTSYGNDTLIGLLYFDNSFEKARAPKTCRELYTLLSGAWHFTMDTTGQNASGNANNLCSQLLFAAQKRESKNFSDVDFQDVRLFAWEVLCFAFRCGDGYELDGKSTHSFLSLSSQGKLKITSDKLPAWGDNACAGTLVVSAPFFCIDGYNVRYQISEAGDFTGRGRREALVSMLFFPSEGTLRLQLMLLASYDPTEKSIRVQQIDQNSHIEIRLRAD